MIQQDMISHAILMLTFGQSCFAKKNCNKVVVNFQKKEHLRHLRQLKIESVEKYACNHCDFINT